MLVHHIRPPELRLRPTCTWNCLWHIWPRNLLCSDRDSLCVGHHWQRHILVGDMLDGVMETLDRDCHHIFAANISHFRHFATGGVNVYLRVSLLEGCLRHQPDWYMAIIAHGPLARYVTLRGAHASGILGTISLPPRLSDTSTHHGTHVRHVPWCMPGSLTWGSFDDGGGVRGPWTTKQQSWSL